MTKKRRKQIKSLIYRMNKDGERYASSMPSSERMKIRIKGDKVYWGYKGGGDFHSAGGGIVSLKEFDLQLRAMEREIKKRPEMVIDTKAKTRNLMMRTFMRNRNISELDFIGRQEKAKRSWKNVFAGELAKLKYQKEFVRINPKQSYEALKIFFLDDYGAPELSATDWRKMRIGERQEWLINNKFGIRKDGSVWYYGDSI